MPKTTRRPPAIGTGSETRVRTRQLTYRLTPDEYAAVARSGEARGWSPAQYARAVVLADAGQTIPAIARRRPDAPPELQSALPVLTALLGDIRHIRTLLNQLAARANAGAVAPACAGYAKAETVVQGLSERIVAAILGEEGAS